jgi:ferric-dicitrate binding protein FerR (iron transport regulator)
MAYADEPVSKVTLAEGSVKVNGRLLKPGEQTINANGLIKITQANVGFELAWKDGYFRFTGSPITSVMRELARWYNIEVVYQGEISADGYYGTISRYKNISQALHMLSYSNQVHFKMEGRRIIVTE